MFISRDIGLIGYDGGSTFLRDVGALAPTARSSFPKDQSLRGHSN